MTGAVLEHGLEFAAVATDARGLDEPALLAIIGPAQLIGVPPQSGEEEWSFQTRALSHGAASLRLGIDLWAARVFPVRKARSTFAGTILVGRAASSDVVLDHASVSKLHARIRAAADGTYFISDAGSRNGTFVGGRRLDSTEVALPFGSKLTVGDWDLRFSRLADTIGLLRSS